MTTDPAHSIAAKDSRPDATTITSGNIAAGTITSSKFRTMPLRVYPPNRKVTWGEVVDVVAQNSNGESWWTQLQAAWTIWRECRRDWKRRDRETPSVEYL
jgi:hypothetical protein